MLSKTRLLSLFPVLSLMIAATPASWATCTSAGTPTTYGSGSTTTSVAVAANFSGPLGTLLTSFVAVNPSYTVIMCSDSTGNIENYIASNPTAFSMFFAADSTPETYYPNNTTYRYAIGTPVLFGYLTSTGKTYTISGLTDLVASQTTSSISANASGLASYTISSTITGGTAKLAIADPTLAPYGLAAENIINAMQPIAAEVASGGSTYLIQNTLPSWMKGLSTYSSITKTYNAVGTAVPAGFVAKSQICNHTADGTLAYVEFTNPAFQTNQWAVNFDTDTVGNALNTYIQDMMTAGTWSTFVTSNCYVGY